MIYKKDLLKKLLTTYNVPIEPSYSRPIVSGRFILWTKIRIKVAKNKSDKIKKDI